jgi:hypothetical protein
MTDTTKTVRFTMTIRPTVSLPGDTKKSFIKIHLIKSFREILHLCLKEAKDFVEAILDASDRHCNLSPANNPRPAFHFTLAQYGHLQALLADNKDERLWRSIEVFDVEIVSAKEDRFDFT